MFAILAGSETCEDVFKFAIKDKLKITLGADLFNAILAFVGTSSYLSMCWLKAVGGA